MLKRRKESFSLSLSISLRDRVYALLNFLQREVLSDLSLRRSNVYRSVYDELPSPFNFSVFVLPVRRDLDYRIERP